MPAVLSFNVLYFGRDREYFPLEDFQEVEDDCHEECSEGFDSCWDSCPENDPKCHDTCVDESDNCDALCEDGGDWDLDEDREEGDGDWYVNYETCSIACDNTLDSCLEGCDEDTCEDACFRAAEYCEQVCIDAEGEASDNSEEWSLEDWQELEEELRNK